VMGNSKVAKQHWYGVMGVMGDSKVAKQYSLLFDTLVLIMGVI